MEIGGIGELVATLRESAGYLVTGTVAMVFFMLAALLWSWRNTARFDEDDDLP